MRIVNVSELRANLKHWLDRVGEEPIIVKRGRKTIAMLISVREYHRLIAKE